MMVIVFSLSMGIILGLFGGGGGILTVPVLHYALDMPMNTSIATSLIILCITSTVSSYHHIKNRHILWRHGLSLGAFSITGTIAGSHLASYIPEHGLILILITMMLASAGAILCKRGHSRQSDSQVKGSIFTLAATGLMIGMMTGLTGSGGGFLVVPALILLFDLAPGPAVATSLFIIAMNSFFGVLTHVSYQSLNWPLITLISIIAIFGTFIGRKLGQRLNVQTMHKLFASFIGGLAIILSVKEIPLIIQQDWFVLHFYIWSALFICMIVGLFYFLTRICLFRYWRSPFFD